MHELRHTLWIAIINTEFCSVERLNKSRYSRFLCTLSPNKLIRWFLYQTRCCSGCCCGKSGKHSFHKSTLWPMRAAIRKWPEVFIFDDDQKDRALSRTWGCREFDFPATTGNPTISLLFQTDIDKFQQPSTKNDSLRRILARFGLWYGYCDHRNITADRDKPTRTKGEEKGTRRERR